MVSPGPNTENLPAPLDEDTYRCLKVGISDDPNTSVWINQGEDFAFLHPKPVINYDTYQSRVHLLGLQTYKKSSEVLEKRLAKISATLATVHSLVEIGAADGAFLTLAHERFPSLDCYAVEPDQNTRPARDALPWLHQLPSLEAAIAVGVKADLIAMFHVFEHLDRPDNLLEDARRILTPEGLLVIEVPSLSDPLLTLYKCSAYEEFYFQRQHPYVYSAPSLARVLATSGFSIERIIPHQRYGLENHLQWLSAGKPGGNEGFRALFTSIDDAYRRRLQDTGATDTIIAIAKVVAA